MTQMHYDELDLNVIERCDGLRKDAGDTIFVAKELEAVKAKPMTRNSLILMR